MPEAILGRRGELALIDSTLRAAALGPAALVIDGEIGVGKSTLWRWACDDGVRRGYRVLTCRPAESERSLAFAALGDLLREALSGPTALPAPQYRSLRVAVLVEEPGAQPPDQLAVSVATLGVLRSLAEETPILLAVDDAQWLDAPTARVLEFVVRRLKQERIGLIAAVRSDATLGAAGIPFSEVAGAPPHRLTPSPLRPDDLDGMFRLHLAGSFPRPILSQIATSSGGNPLFALEIGRAIQRAQIRAEPGRPLPVPRTLNEFVRGRLEGLPDSLRELLFLAAAVPDPTVELMERAGGHGDVRELLETAVRATVIEVEGDAVSFCHPLFASVLYHGLSTDRRRTLHGRLARLVSSPHERARHLSLAADGPDPAVATALDEAAADAASRGAPDAAASLSQQAHAMTPTTDPGARDRRRVDVAEYLFAAGNTALARQLLEELVSATPAGPERADFLRRLAKVRYRQDSSATAAELLTRALAEAGTDATLRAGIERDLAWAVTLCGDVRDAAEHVDAALALVDDDEGPLLPELLAAKAMSEFLRGNGISAEAIGRAVALERADRAVPIEWRPSMVHGMLLRWSGDIGSARRRFGDLHTQTVESGDATSLPFLLAQLSETETLTGAWADAREHAEEARAVALQTGQLPMEAVALYSRGLAEAHVGLVEAARVSARAGMDLAERSGSVVSMLLNQTVLGFVELSLDEPAAAHERLGPLVTWLEVIGIRDPGILRFIPDEAEALVGIGQVDRAASLLDGYEADAARVGNRPAVLAAARSRALVLAAFADPAAAIELLDRALRVDQGYSPPFERARALLVLGAIERRTRRRAAARASLQQALDAFRELGATLWAGKAERMLGVRDGEPGPARTQQLTAAERRVADLVVTGMTNREVADRLFVSVRAVEVHLTHIYRKLSIRSRMQLASMLKTTEPGGDPTDGPSSG